MTGGPPTALKESARDAGLGIHPGSLLLLQRSQNIPVTLVVVSVIH